MLLLLRFARSRSHLSKTKPLPLTEASLNGALLLRLMSPSVCQQQSSTAWVKSVMPTGLFYRTRLTPITHAIDRKRTPREYLESLGVARLISPFGLGCWFNYPSASTSHQNRLQGQISVLWCAVLNRTDTVALLGSGSTMTGFEPATFASAMHDHYASSSILVGRRCPSSHPTIARIQAFAFRVVSCHPDDQRLSVQVSYGHPHQLAVLALPL